MSQNHRSLVSATVSGLALGLILALAAMPSLAAPHGGHDGGGHEGGGYQGERGGGRGGWNNATSSSTSRDYVRPAAPATSPRRDSRTPATNSTGNSNRPWWGSNNHAPLNGRPPQTQTQTTTQSTTHYDNARGRGPDHDDRDRSARGDHNWNGGHNDGNNDRGDHNWNGGGDRGDRYGGGDRNNHYGNGGYGGYNRGGYSYGGYSRGRTHFDWHDNQHFRGYSGVRYGYYFFPGVGYYNVPSQWYGHRWLEGEYLPDFFDSYRIYDWQAYDLPIPPYGCAWYFLGEDAVLADVDTGRILDVIYDFY
ncbi:RcnB family protein [Asticcacaulis sp. EMRT-3]|uniref:RcnB family protein n=1 Tax=Asticcacaulis sp. EMRT-3 TaxID=3040349 RepID=UPI0024AF53B7|nr:RcnB family protein [Asticcacaulis sp. EMRT-3]MDI7774068.1 RcnB family protein [Asticcacaulis sp. EMRT-3]